MSLSISRETHGDEWGRLLKDFCIPTRHGCWDDRIHMLLVWVGVSANSETQAHTSLMSGDQGKPGSEGSLCFGAPMSRSVLTFAF